MVPVAHMSGRACDAPDKPYQCHVCESRFVLRKHLAAHQARSHRIWSPARHFALGPYCLSCHRWTGDVRLIQQHLKHSDVCLRRMLDIIPPLSTEQIHCVEQESIAREKALRGGGGSSFVAQVPPLRC